MRLRRGTVIIVAVGVLLAGCGGGDDSMTASLQEQNGSGASGEVTLTWVDAERTRVLIELQGGPTGPKPAHIHERACSDIDPVPANNLENVVEGRSETVVDVSLEHLRSVPHAINVHRSAEALDETVACATVGGEDAIEAPGNGGY
jgi:Cu/Zn superoxide dismutase